MTLFDMIQEMKDKPTVYGKVHESVYRIWDVVRILREMLDRGDSRVTMKEFIAWYIREGAKGGKEE